jgi:malic enzyme
MITDLLCVVYTPTVGAVCQQFGSQYRRTRGMYFSRYDRGIFNSMLYNWPHADVHVSRLCSL